MKKTFFLLLILLCGLNAYSQIIFEQGYYIDNSGRKTECLIKNVDWIDNPTQFKYQLSESKKELMLTIDDVKEFGVYNQFKYIREDIEIDESSSDINNLSTTKEPILVKKRIFLKLLIEGEASLYSYRNGEMNRYFYKTINSNVKQLIYKEYTDNNGRIRKNSEYKQQLWNVLRCEKTTMREVDKINYRRVDLIRFFTSYNQCKGTKSISFEKNKHKDLFNLNVRPGIKSSSLSIENSVVPSRNADFGSEFGFRFGIEAEIVFSFNKNKWALIVEPTYQSYTSQINRVINSNTSLESVVSDTADYSSIELPIGIRHYFFLPNESKFFVNGSIILDVNAGSSTIDFDQGALLEINSGPSVAFGIGFKTKDRYSVELRYQHDRDLLTDYSAWLSKYTTLSLIFGYTLF